MIAILGDEFDRKNQQFLKSVSVITDEFPDGFFHKDKTYKLIVDLANKYNARKVNSPISYHNNKNKRERSIIVTFRNIEDKNSFVSELQSIAN